MQKGVSSEDEVKQRVLFLASDEKEHQISYFIKMNDHAKNTVYKYLKDLKTDKLLEARLPENSFRPVIRITEKGLAEVRRLKLKSSMNQIVDGASDKEVQRLQQELADREGLIENLKTSLTDIERALRQKLASQELAERG